MHPSVGISFVRNRTLIQSTGLLTCFCFLPWRVYQLLGTEQLLSPWSHDMPFWNRHLWIRSVPIRPWEIGGNWDASVITIDKSSVSSSVALAEDRLLAREYAGSRCAPRWNASWIFWFYDGTSFDFLSLLGCFLTLPITRGVDTMLSFT